MAPVQLSADRLEALLQLPGPADLQAVRAELQEAGVLFGLDEAALCEACAQGTNGELVLVARGKAPVAARPARIDLQINLDEQAGAVEAESDRIDFRERGGMCSVDAGTLLGTLWPAEEGEAGVGVDGEALAPLPCGESGSSVGLGVRFVEGPQGSQLLHAEFDGVVRVSGGGQLHVSDALEIRGDVDLETGNLDVKGSLIVRGAIRAGFRVKARKDILVSEVIEDAHVMAGGSLQVGGGIIGGGESVIRATEGIRAKFSQNAVLRCDADIVLQSDTHSRVECRGELLATGTPGCLRGGNYWAGGGLRARELGSEHGVVTRVQVGEDPVLMRQVARLRSTLDSTHSRVMKLQRERSVENAKRVGGTLTPDIAKGVRRNMKALRDQTKQQGMLQKQLAEMEAQLFGVDCPTIRVESTLHAGVELCIGSASLLITHKRSGGVFRLDEDTQEITTDRPKRS